MDVTENILTISDLVKRWQPWQVKRAAIHRLLQSQPGVVRLFTGPMKQNPRFRIPESVVLRIEAELFQVNASAPTS